METYDSIVIEFTAKVKPNSALEKSQHARLVDDVVVGLEQFMKDGRVVLLGLARKRALTKFKIAVSES
jgi:hypothetical protein